jgi:hypothetical protein
LAAIDFLEVGVDETDKKPSLALAKYLFFLVYALWEV